MSVSASATLIWGFKLELHQLSTQVTRFHEETGAPYQKDVPDGYTCGIEGIIFNKEVWNDIDKNGEYMGLDLLLKYEPDQYFLGIALAKTGDIMYNPDVSEVEDTTMPKLIEQFIKKMYDEHGYVLTATMFLIPSCG
jgi:hypothetical protein